jgi:phosphatidylethanolamine/phosphatidyl-N-methylethanolamine N-methyltransferase
MKDLPLFMGQFLRNPSEVMAVAPSAAGLAVAMVQGIGAATGPVAELGPGTGRITRALLAAGVAPRDLILVERNPAFAERLRQDFAGLRVECLSAEVMDALRLSGLGAVVSGLPLLSMPRASQRAILHAAFGALRKGGRFVQFTYGARPPVDDAIAAGLGLGVLRGPSVWANLPPARVFSYARRADLGDMAEAAVA